MRRGVDRANSRAHPSVRVLEFPTHERTEADDSIVRRRDPGGRRSERVLLVLPREELVEEVVGRASAASPRAAARTAPRSSGRIGRIAMSVAPVLNGRGPPRTCAPSRAPRASTAKSGRRATAARVMAWRRSGSVASAINAFASSSGSDGGTSTASFVSPKTSLMPPTSVATTGRPSVSASSIAIGSPSWCDARQKTSNADITRTASARYPVNRKRSPSPRSAWSARNSASSGP